MIRRLVPWALVAACAVGYPAIVAAGGAPRFPTRADCTPPPRAGDEIVAVFGVFRERNRATAVARRARRAGFAELDVERNACGDVEVVLHGVPSLAVGRDLQAEAARVGFRVTLVRPAR
ncbi:MAG: hypothetical protein ACJ74D_04615 [Gaiellaceae bacterium]